MRRGYHSPIGPIGPIGPIFPIPPIFPIFPILSRVLFLIPVHVGGGATKREQKKSEPPEREAPTYYAVKRPAMSLEWKWTRVYTAILVTVNKYQVYSDCAIATINNYVNST